MKYNPTNQYRCTIIRGKSQTEMEDMLPFYAHMVHTNCPCTKEEFQKRCYKSISQLLFDVSDFDSLPDNNKKTVKNHITEIAGKLLGLYRTDADGYVFETESCVFLQEKNDYPLFFKNLCANLQFPNGSQKIQTIKERIDHEIQIKPLCYVVTLLDYACRQGDKLLTKQEIGYYVLNSLDVLQGKVAVNEVYDQIMLDRANHVRRERLSGSNEWQHIKEQLNLLNLSNVTCSDNDYIWLNKEETAAIDVFKKKNIEPLFDIYGYDLSTQSDRNEMFANWDLYYGKVDERFRNLETVFDKAEVRKEIKETGAVGLSTVELGDQGEALVYRLECERVKQFKERLVNKVLLLGKTKGLGYDICSVEANENPAKPEYARYIEVKSTIRTTEPRIGDAAWTDFLNLSAKEWIAAEQYGDFFNIYRVYFTKSKTIVARMKNPYLLAQQGDIDVYPTAFRMDFNGLAIKKQYEQAL